MDVHPPKYGTIGFDPWPYRSLFMFESNFPWHGIRCRGQRPRFEEQRLQLQNRCSEMENRGDPRGRQGGVVQVGKGAKLGHNLCPRKRSASWWAYLQYLLCFMVLITWLVVTGTCYIFPYIWNNHPNWLIFFGGVGQPPSRKNIITIVRWVLIPTTYNVWGPHIVTPICFMATHSWMGYLQYMSYQHWGAMKSSPAILVWWFQSQKKDIWFLKPWNLSLQIVTFTISLQTNLTHTKHGEFRMNKLESQHVATSSIGNVPRSYPSVTKHNDYGELWLTSTTHDIYGVCTISEKSTDPEKNRSERFLQDPGCCI